MVNASNIREHMEVVGSDGQHVGTVDHVEGNDRIKLTRDDPASGGEHHFIPLSWVSEVGQEVRLDKSAQTAKQEWRAGSSRSSGGTQQQRM
ncbi:MAG TPA: DUF2171 domain-containing protein [Gemmatimonadales bacterium]|nr:DUF2171 domain-containing protein [Gemmatimonadales bacterium]